jgi:hypothetical protein
MECTESSSAPAFAFRKIPNVQFNRISLYYFLLGLVSTTEELLDRKVAAPV